MKNEEIPATSAMMRVDLLPMCGLLLPRLKFEFSVVEEVVEIREVVAPLPLDVRLGGGVSETVNTIWSVPPASV